MSTPTPHDGAGHEPERDPFAEIFTKLAEIDPQDAAALRLVLQKQDPAVDANNEILEQVMAQAGPMIERVVRETVTHIEEARSKQLAASKAGSLPSSVELADMADTAEPPPTRLTVAKIAAPFMDGLNESLRRANDEARRRAKHAKTKAEELSLAAFDTALRGYFFLFGLPGRTAVEIKIMYDGMTPKQQSYVDNIAGNLISSAIWAGAAALVGWALLS